jgi:hypothetical protein
VPKLVAKTRAEKLCTSKRRRCSGHVFKEERISSSVAYPAYLTQNKWLCCVEYQWWRFVAYRVSGGLSGEATETGPHPHLSTNLNKNLFLRISILQICFYIIIIL